MVIDEGHFLFTDFADLLERDCNLLDTSVHSVHESDDEENVIHKLDANSLTLNELLHEMERRGLQPRGFFADDAKLLQTELDKEHEIYIQKKRRERQEARELEKKQAILQRRKKLVADHLFEEEEEIKNDPVIQGWLDLIHHDTAPSISRIDLNNITSRALSKCIWSGCNIVCLDVSNMGLSDLSGAYICRSLRKNRSIKKLELGSNLFGSITIESLADALSSNNIVKHVGLESNSLMGKEGIFSIELLANMLTKNRSLQYLSLWRCGTGTESGKLFSSAMDENKSMLYFDLGYNGWHHSDVLRIAEKLKMNRKNWEERLRGEDDLLNQKHREADLESKEVYEKKQLENTEKWLNQQKIERANSRRRKIENKMIMED